MKFFAASLLAASLVDACLRHGPAPVDVATRPRHLWPRQVEGQNATQSKTAIYNVRVFDGYKVTEPTTVIIDGGFITEDATSIDHAIDGLGRVLIPGLFDTHVHVFSIEDLQMLSSFGVTTALTQSCANYKLCQSLNDLVGLTSHHYASFASLGPNGAHSIALEIPRETTIETLDHALQAVDWAFGNGSSWLKIVAEPGGLSLDFQHAMIKATHERGQRVTSHAWDLATLHEVLGTDTDSIQHVPVDGLIDDATLTKIVDSGLHVTATLEAFRVLINDDWAAPALHLDQANVTYDTGLRNVGLLHRAGVPVLAGSDSITDPRVAAPHGDMLHSELANLVDAGLSPAAALRAATIVPALVYNLTDRGVIAPGKRADLLLLNSDPLANISNTRDIARVWIGGVEYRDINKKATK